MTAARPDQAHRFCWYDWVYILLALIATGWSFVFFWTSPGTRLQGQTADIIVSQKTVLTVPLQLDKIYTVQGHIGKSIIVVKQGKIRFRHSPCQKKYCILSGWHELSGDVAACLPNRVIIRVNGTPKGYDVLSY